MMTQEQTTRVMQPDEGMVIAAFGDTLQLKLTSAQTGGLLATGLLTTPPGGGPPPHRHLREDELFFVVEGRYRFFAHGAWTEAGPGNVIYAPRGEVHTFQNIGETPGKAWVLATPGGFESFFQECAAVFAAAATTGELDMPRMVEISTNYGIEYVPPLL